MKIRRKYLFYALAFTSAITVAGVSAIDTTISVRYIQDSWAFGLSCFLVGTIISFIIVLVLSIPIVGGKSLGSKIIDPSFKKLRLVRKEELKFHLIAGTGNSILTIGYLTLLSILGDPSTVLPFSQIVILYLIFVESIVEKNIPTLSEIQSSFIIMFGAILGSISLTGIISLESLVIVFLVIGTMLYGIHFSFGLFFKSIEAEFSLTRTATSAILSANLLLAGLFSFFFGWALDRYGPRLVVLLMVVFTGLSLVLTSQTNTLWQLFITYSLLPAMGTGDVSPMIDTDDNATGIPRLTISIRISVTSGLRLSGLDIQEVMKERMGRFWSSPIPPATIAPNSSTSTTFSG